MTQPNHTCKECGIAYHSRNTVSNFCGNKCRLAFGRKANPKVERTIECAFCKTEFKSSRKNAKFCSKQCTQDWGNLQIQNARREENNALYENVSDIPTCVICGWKSRSLQGHLKTHNLTVDEYRTQYSLANDQIFHRSYTDDISQRMIGENNPGYDHGGTMSSFSKKYEQYADLTEEEKEAAIAEQIAKANATKSETAGYNTRSDFYEVRHGMTTEEATVAVSKRQSTFSLEKCIEKFGEKLGTAVWSDRQFKWQSTLDSLPHDIKMDIERRKALNLRNGRGLTNQLRVCRLDYVLGMKVIEFNGDYWHANPLVEKYTADDTIIKLPGGKQKTAKEIREKDAARQKELEEMGYEVFVVWESDYRRNKQQVIEKCLEFLKQ